MADCVIMLDQRIDEQISTRRLRVVKYRGSAHGTNEYPFLIGERGFSVLPITSCGSIMRPLQAHPHGHCAARRDARRQGRLSRQQRAGFRFAGHGQEQHRREFVDAACRRGERALLFAYEESPAQILRNMRSIGIDLEPWVKKGLLQIHASRPTLHGLEQHLVMMHDTVRAFHPAVVVVDPISNLTLDRNEWR